MSFLFNINVCRVCMQNEQSCDLLKDKSLLEKFEFTTRLAISEKDNLPKSICTKCSTRLKVAYIFIKNAHESENNLKAFIRKINTDFKEVSHANKSVKKQSNEQNLTEDELLSLMDYDDCQNFVHDKEIKERCKTAPNPEYKDKKFKAELENSDVKVGKLPKIALKSKEDDIDNTKNKNAFHLSDDIMLISDNRNEVDNEFDNNTHFMEISNPDEEEDTETGLFTDDNHDTDLDQEKTESGDNALAVSDEIESQSQSTELGVEDTEENPDYEKLINSQVDSLNFPAIYTDENSTEDINNKEDTYYITHINEDVTDNLEEKSPSKESIAEEREQTVTKLSFKKENYGHRFYCEKCNCDFSTKTNLNRHMQSHAGNKRFSCTECDKSFTQKSTLKQHMYTHTGERPYVCEVCNRGFTQCKSLIFHMRRHTGEKPFHCEYCLITFRQKDALRNHILKHHVVVEQTADGISIFTCIICQKKFNTKSAFKAHMKVHTASAEVDNIINFIKDESEECSTKKIIQNENSNLLIPIDSECINAAVVDVSSSSAAEPSRAKKFLCRKCFKCFALKKSLVRHMRLHFSNNGNELSECLECDLQFSSYDMYQEHLVESHQYACSYCPGMIFKTIEDLRGHMFEHDLDQQE